MEASEKLALMGGAVTGLLVWGTGQWERGIRWPRRWLGTTNRGLRGFNLRVVRIKGKWYRETVSHLSFLLPFGLWREAGGSDWHYVDNESGHVVEEDLAHGGDHIMLLLLPKSFSPEFRTNWEEYRNEYWGKENARRAHLRKKLNVNRRQKARETGGWTWWTGAWRLLHHPQKKITKDIEKHPSGHAQTARMLSEKEALKVARRRSLLRSDSAHSRQSSRSSTPITAEFDGVSEKPTGERVRRGSSVSSTASVRRKIKDRSHSGGLSPLTVTEGGDVEKERKERRERRERRAKEKEGMVDGPTTPIGEITEKEKIASPPPA